MKEAWAKRGAAFFQSRARRTAPATERDTGGVRAQPAARNRQQEGARNLRTWQVERRKRTRHLIELGGLVVKAGFVDRRRPRYDLRRAAIGNSVPGQDGRPTPREPDGANTDNVAVFARTIGVELRFNAWVEPCRNSLVRFRRALSALAYEATFDPVLERLAAAQAAWDGVPRLSGWLARALGTPNDAYRTEVGRSLLGGICKRVTHPGCKHDDVVILMGPEVHLLPRACSPR